MSGVCAGEFAKDQCSPGESPELISVGERDSAADAEVFCGELLEEVADDPDEAAEEEPEDEPRPVDEGEGGRGESGLTSIMGD